MYIAIKQCNRLYKKLMKGGITMDIKSLVDLTMEELKVEEVIEAEEINSVLACGITSGGGVCGKGPAGGR